MTVTPNPPSDATLVHQVRRGDPQAFGLLYDRYARLIRAICHDTVADLSQAQDLAQETFLRAYRNLDDLRDPDKFIAWLVGIARLVCSEWRRSKARDRHRYIGLSPDDSIVTDPPPDPESSHALHNALTTLPEDERLAVHLFYLQEQPLEHARTLLGLSRSGFYRVLERARAHLETLLRHNLEVRP